MKRLVRSKSGTLIFGKKWQNIETEGSNEFESDNELVSAASGSRTTTEIKSGIAAAAEPPTVMETSVVQPPTPGQTEGLDNENRPSRGNTTASVLDCRLMYKAASEGAWVDAEERLKRHPTLLRDELTEKGDKALHVAVAMKHREFVRKLLKKMSPSDLESLDGHGYTACCYAAISGATSIAKVLMEEYPATTMMKEKKNLATADDKYGMTPLHKAASRENTEIVLYFLETTKSGDLSEEQWLDLLLITVRRKMFDVALKILGKNGSRDWMTNREGISSALYLLARHDVLDLWTSKRSGIRGSIYGKFTAVLKIYMSTGAIDRVMQGDLRSLAEGLWDRIRGMDDQAYMLQLITKPPLLHEAARVGNVDLIDMLIHTYPHLIWVTDSRGYTIFHIAVIYRQENVFKLIHRMGAMRDLIATSQDKNGNNILHLAGKLAPLDGSDIFSQSALKLRRELMWFKEVEAIVPPSCLEMRNKKGYRPRELFSKEHKKLVEMSKTWMMNTADSCMLIATIILTVVFTAAFSVPGGINQYTGIPILIKKNWFACFLLFEVSAMYGSILCIISFWAIMTSSFEEDQFLRILPGKLKWGLGGLFGSLISTVTAFMSAYFLVFVEAKAAWLIKGYLLLAYVILLVVIYVEYFKISFKTILPDVMSQYRAIRSCGLFRYSDRRRMSRQLFL